MISSILKWSGHAIVALVLAVVTQVGLLSYLSSVALFQLSKIRNIGVFVSINLVLYGLISFLITPLLAPVFGRVPVSTHQNLKFANSILSVGLNRNYVNPELDRLLSSLSEKVATIEPSAVVLVLDANFPFANGYPLVPHLSHSDGRKIDLAYIYVDLEGNLLNKTASNSGYGYFENPAEGEKDTTRFCKNEGYFQYDYSKYFTFGVDDQDFFFSNDWNKVLLEVLLSESGIQKIFVERHIVDRLGLTDDRLRFQGCGSVRHDDHIHIQI